MASAESPGQFTIDMSDQSQNNPSQVFSEHTSIISGNAVAVPVGATRDAIPEAFKGFTKQQMPRCRGRLIVSDKSDAAVVLESEESRWEIPVLEWNEAGQLIGRRTLTQETMTGFTRAGTVDATLPAGVKSQLAYQDVPRGILWSLDPNGKIRAYLGDNA